MTTVKNKQRTLEEWVQIYENKTHEKSEIHEGFTLLYIPDRGYMTLKVLDDMVIVDETCGDGRFWRDVAELIAVGGGCKVIGTFLVRGVKAYLRTFGAELVEEQHEMVENNGSVCEWDRYVAKDSTGRAVVITFVGITPAGNRKYVVTQRLEKGKIPTLEELAKKNIDIPAE